MAFALPAAAGAFGSLQTIGTIISIASTIFGAISEKKQADENNRLLEEDKRAEALATLQQEDLLNEEKRKKISQLQNAAGVSGVSAGEGSPLLALEEQFFNFEREIQNLKSAGASATRRISLQQDIQETEGNNALTSGLFGAASTGTSLLTSGITSKPLTGTKTFKKHNLAGISII